MRCQEFARRITDHLEGALRAKDRRRAERHLAGCDDCAHYLQQMELMLSQLAELRPETERKDPPWL
jgi:anti-sigma factor RsiW